MVTEDLHGICLKLRQPPIKFDVPKPLTHTIYINYTPFHYLVAFSWTLTNERQGGSSPGRIDNTGMVTATGEGGVWVWATYTNCANSIPRCTRGATTGRCARASPCSGTPTTATCSSTPRSAAWPTLS